MSQRVLIDLTGKRFGRLVVTGRSPDNYVSPGGQSQVRWETVCDCGKTKTIMGATLRRGAATSCGCYAMELRVARGKANAVERPTYNSLHHRLRKARGSARSHRCHDCGKRAQAWSYQHDDPNELTEPHTLKSGRVIHLRYSTDLSRYVPRCKSCHNVFDVQMKRGAA